MTEGEEASLKRLFARVLTFSLALPVTATACSKSSSHEPDASVRDTGVEDPCAPELGRVILPSSNDAGVCDAYQRLPCGLPPSVRPVDGGCRFGVNDCSFLCPSYGAFTCRAADASCPAGKLATPSDVSVVVCDFCGGSLGRRPRGLERPKDPRYGNVLGAFLAQAAHLEAASVRAFEDLSVALETLGAPRELSVGARAAARDEIRHARTTSRLARRHGARRAAVRVRASAGAPTLEELASENAVEGCVRETYGALVASWQSLHARDAEVARAMGPIAGDETRHAALAWAIYRWSMPLLSRPARTRVAEAFERAVAELNLEIREPDGNLVCELGIPGASAQRRLVSALARDLWSARVRAA